MIDFLDEVKAEGIQMALLPIAYLEHVKRDVKKVFKENKVNGFQTWLYDNYVLDVPKEIFDIASMVIAIMPLKLSHITFWYQDKKASCIIDDSFSISPMYKALKKLFNAAGKQLKINYWLPHKYLAAKSGLTMYGRNNITYSKTWGSFIRIETFFSDIKPAFDPWTDNIMLAECKHCKSCLKRCPTKAIFSNRFLIDTDRCLAKINSEANAPFYSWIPTMAHQRLIECILCQSCCPLNKKTLRDIKNMKWYKDGRHKKLCLPSFVVY